MFNLQFSYRRFLIQRYIFIYKFSFLFFFDLFLCGRVQCIYRCIFSCVPRFLRLISIKLALNIFIEQSRGASRKRPAQRSIAQRVFSSVGQSISPAHEKLALRLNCFRKLCGLAIAFIMHNISPILWLPTLIELLDEKVAIYSYFNILTICILE